ncbi:MAG TPA: ATP-binding protein [Firmicutes bacterium]|nr:ATP-binding protein [Bacillota bacterium]
MKHARAYTKVQFRVIITSNLEFGRWNEVFGNYGLTTALIDRLIHRSYILGFKGPSYRYRQALQSQRGDEEPTDTT